MTEVPVRDEAPPPPGRARTRRRRMGTLVAIVGAGAAFVALQHHGSNPAPAPLPTTTSVVQLTTIPGVVPSSTTTTSLVTALQLRPLISARTGTVLAMEAPDGTKLLDVDASILRLDTRLGRSPLAPGDHGFVEVQGGYMYFVPADGSGPEIVETLNFGGGALTNGSALWLAMGGGRWSEVDGRGHLTGRTLTTPKDFNSVIAVGQGLVVEQRGSLTYVGTDGTPRAIGFGFPLAAAGDTLVSERCEAFACRAYVTDIRTSAVKRLESVPPLDGLRSASLSRDVRWLAINSKKPADHGLLALVDLRTDRVVFSDDAADAVAFSPTSAFLFVARSGQLTAYELGSLRRFALDGADATNAQGLFATER